MIADWMRSSGKMTVLHVKIFEEIARRIINKSIKYIITKLS